MKALIVTLLAVVAAASARSVGDIQDLTPYNLFFKDHYRLDKYDGQHLRIVGGQASGNGAFPYQAALMLRFVSRDTVCGGSLVSNNRVVTAAHCWNDGWEQALDVTVVLGTNLLFSGGTRIVTTSVAVHPNWDANTIRNDIAVITISSVGFTNLISPIALPSGAELNEDYTGFTATISGFGITGDGHQIAENQFLSHVDVPIITNTECEAVYTSTFVQPSNICTSGSGGRGGCHSDSGGPVVVRRNGRTILVGVVSFVAGTGCERGFPGGHARVSSFIDFINQNL